MDSDSPYLDQNHSVSLLIDQLKHDNIEAANEIWRRYFQKLLPVARSKLALVRDPVVDEEDILVVVFERFFRAASDGRFANLNDRDDLWHILLAITERNVIDHYRRTTTERRGRDRVINQSNLSKIDISQLREAADRGPSPDYVATFNERLANSLRVLKESSTKEVAILKLEGYSNHEICQKLELSISSIERKLRVIREVWTDEI